MIVKPLGSVLTPSVEWELADGESIVDDADTGWTVLPDEAGGISCEGQEVSAGRTSCRLPGGILGSIYEVVAFMKSSTGRRDYRVITYIIGITEAVQ